MQPASEGAIPLGLPDEGAAWDRRALPRGVVFAAAVLALALALLLVWQLRPIVVLVLVATTVAYILEPIVHRAEARGIRRTWCALMAGLLVAGLEVVGFGWLLPQVALEGVALARELPSMLTQLTERIGAHLNLSALVDRVSAAGGGAGWAGERVVDVARAAVGRTASAVALVLLFPVLVALLVVHLPGARRAMAFVPRRKRADVRRLASSMDVAVGGFFRGRVIISMIVGTLLALGWWICGVPHALALGFLAGVLNLVPFASTIACVLAVLLGFTAGSAGDGPTSWISIALWPAAVYVAVNALENSVLTPWIQSQAVNLSALTIMLASLIGGSLFGAVGLFYAIPFAACMKTLLREVVVPRARMWAEHR